MYLLAKDEELFVIDTMLAAISDATELLNDVVEPLIVVSVLLLARFVATSAAILDETLVNEPLIVVFVLLLARFEATSAAILDDTLVNEPLIVVDVPDVSDAGSTVSLSGVINLASPMRAPWNDISLEGAEVNLTCEPLDEPANVKAVVGC